MVYSMSGFVESSIILQNIIMFIMEICLILELILLIFRIMSLVGKKKILVSAAEVVFSFLFMTGLLNDHRCSMGDKGYRPLLRFFPADIMLILVILLTVYLIRVLYRELKEYRNALSPWSVHEAVNNVPCGVCISDPLGRIILCNIKMQELSRVLIGNYLQNYHTLHSVLNADSVKKPVRKLSSDSNVFYFPDGSVWLFQEYQLKEAAFTGYIQTVAVDVSEIYHNSEEIRRNNEKLELLNRKLEKMYEKIGDEIREKETLAMKMKVHDSFGRSLLSIRRILENKEEPENMEKQMETLKQLVYILTGTTVKNEGEQYKDTEKHAEELGITVQIRGSYPKHPIYRLLTDKAIRECVTNCARHAHGSVVYVNMKENRDGYQVRITNDGKPPVKNAKEGGGLSALRKAVEAEQGTMKTFFEPAFYLFLNFQLKA